MDGQIEEKSRAERSSRESDRAAVGYLGGHLHERSGRSETKRENWPGEGDFKTTVRQYGPTIDQSEEAPRPLGLGEELRELERFVESRFGPGDASPGVLSRVRRLLVGQTFRDELRRLQLRSRAEIVDEFGYDSRFTELCAPLLRFLYERYFRVCLRGVSNIPEHGRALLVANHSGTLPLDAAMIMVGVKREHTAHRTVRPLVEDFVYHTPFAGTAIRRIGGVRANFQNAERLLEHGQLAAVFPEGIQGVTKHFRDRYRLQRFGRGGFVKLALKTRAPIVPVSVLGAEETYPVLAKVSFMSRSLGIPFLPVTPTFPWLGPLGLLPLPSKWSIAFGEPIHVHEQFDVRDWENRILVNKVAEQVRSTIQQMVDTGLKKRRSIFFG